jgi:hypothetical protein
VGGVVGEADVWVNGTQVASRATVQGAYTRYTFDVTGLLRHGANALALELYPNDPSTMFTLDNVDWTQIAPDNNTGIQFPIQLHTSGPLALSNAHVVQIDTPDVSSSALTVKGVVTNNSNTRQTGDVSASVTPPTGQAIRVHRTVSVPAGATRTIAFTPSDDPQLQIDHPQLWWPYPMGGQPLYRLTMAVSQAGYGPDWQSETFGIRTITTRLVGPAPIAPHGSRQFLVNGKPFMFRGGGWSEDLFLRYSASDTADQIALIKNLGLNGIRTEGKQMPDDFYEQMDRAGILIDAGFQCCDAWQLQDSGLTTDHDFAVLELSARTIGENLRNHPSILNFSWSDNQPTKRQEKVSLQGFSDADFQEPLIASAEYKRSDGTRDHGGRPRRRRRRAASGRPRRHDPADARADVLRRASAAPSRPRDRPQRVLALDPTRRGRLGEDDGQSTGDDDAVRRPGSAPAPVAGRCARQRGHPRRGGTRRSRRCHHPGENHEHLEHADGRVLPPRGRPARDALGHATPGRQRGAPDLLERQRRHALAR